jgi:hypothetical protein
MPRGSRRRSLYSLDPRFVSPWRAEAVAAVKRAVTVTAASADRSGTAVVRITHDGELWAGTTIRWSDGDIAISSDTPGRSGRAGAEMRVVDGVLYGTDPVEGGWIEQGSPANIDPDSGTTPGEHLAAVREDVEGVTLRRLGENIAGKSAGYRPLCSVVASVGPGHPRATEDTRATSSRISAAKSTFPTRVSGSSSLNSTSRGHDHLIRRSRQ